MSNGESAEPSVLWLKGQALEDAKADVDVWEQVHKPSSAKVEAIRRLIEKATEDGLTDTEVRKLQRIQNLAKEPREHGVQIPMQYEDGLVRMDADQVKQVRDAMARLSDFPREYVDATEHLLAKAQEDGLSKPELADLEGRVLHIANRLETGQQEEGGTAVDSKSSRIRRAFNRARFRKGVQLAREEPVEPPKDYERPGDFERKRALGALKAESKKVKDRIRAEQIGRVHRMRTTDPRHKAEKRERENNEAIPKEERIRRLNILLRVGMYDRGRAERLMKSKGDTVEVRMTRESGKTETIKVPKSDIKNWFDSLLPHEQKRLYVIGRKRLDFKMDRNREEYRGMTDEEFADEVEFQKGQKELADALEVVALPMLRGVFKNLGKNADVYLTSSNDDIAGGLDVAIDLLKADGTPETFSDGKPMRFVVDMTYARMRSKAKIDLARGRMSPEAYSILQDRDKEIPWQLSNARAMKLFRTVVETLGDTMSTQTFDKNGPLEKPQEHVPRLIIGLDWENAFSAISQWVEDDNFEEKYRHTTFSRSVERSIRNQLLGLQAVAARHNKDNPNIKYIDEIVQKIGFKRDRLRWKRASTDSSLSNIEGLLTRDLLSRSKWAYNRFYAAALAQVEYDARGGKHVRGDMPVTMPSPSPLPVPPTLHIPPVAPAAKELPKAIPSDDDDLQKHLEEVRKAKALARIRELEKKLSEMG